MGFTVFAGVRNQADGDALIKGSSGPLTPIILDVTDDDSIRRSAEFVASSVGEKGLAGLVNNAGIVVTGPLEFIRKDDLWEQFHVNLMGQVAVTQAFLPLLKKCKGRIVNITSIGGRQSVPFMGPYCASKAAMEVLSDSLRMELRPFDLPVIIVTPGNISTPIWSKTRKISEQRTHELATKVRNLYGASLDLVLKASAKMEKSGIDPIAVARVVAHALTTGKPKTRYIVGWDARLQIVMSKVLPDWIRDYIVLRFIGLASSRKNYKGGADG